MLTTEINDPQVAVGKPPALFRIKKIMGGMMESNKLPLLEKTVLSSSHISCHYDIFPPILCQLDSGQHFELPGT
jgi:hypothetical protein